MDFILTAAGVVRWIDLPGLGIGGIRVQIAATASVIWWIYRFERFVWVHLSFSF
jgi:hypothetical protein